MTEVSNVLGMHAIAAILLTVFALFLFSRDRIPLETSCFIVLIVLIVGFEVFPFDGPKGKFGPQEILAGFGNAALITIVALLVCSKALQATGALNAMTKVLVQLWNSWPSFGLLFTMVTAAFASMFMNNTPIVAMFLPLLVAVCMRTGTSTSGVLMPVGFATILGGMATTIGTSTNLLVVELSVELGMERMQMFDFFLPVLIAGSVGILFLWLIGPRLLPDRTPPMASNSPRVFRAVLHVTASSKILGKTLKDAREITRGRLKVERIARASGLFIARLPTSVFHEGDLLYIRGQTDELREFASVLGAPLHLKTGTSAAVDNDWFDEKTPQQLAEIVVTRNSPLDGAVLPMPNLLQSGGLIPVAVHKADRQISLTGESIPDSEELTLTVGDIVLVQGTEKRIKELKQAGLMLVLDGSVDLPHTSKALLAGVIMIGVVSVAAFGILPIFVTSLIGAVLCIVGGCVSRRQLPNTVDTNLVLMIVTALALGKALMVTGATDYIAGLFVAMAGGLPPPMVIAILMLGTALLTEVISNNAAAVLVTPIAFSIAESMGLDVRPVVIAVMFGANMSYMTPVGYQTNLLIMSAGGYKFSDFIRLGLPLQIIMWAVLSFLLAIGF